MNSEQKLGQLKLAQLKLISVVLGGLLLAACHKNEPTAAGPAMTPQPDVAAQVNKLADELLAHLRATSVYVRQQSGLPIEHFDPVSLQSAQQEAAFSKDMLARVDAIALDRVPHQQWLLAKMLRHTFAAGEQAEQGYWLEFAVTPYGGGFRLNAAHSILAGQPLKTQADLDSYLSLLDSYATTIDQMAAKTRAQAERDIRVPKAAIPGVLATFRGLASAAPNTLLPKPERLAGLPVQASEAFQKAAQQRLADRIVPAYQAVVAIFDDAYVSKAPAAVGLGNYPGGKQRYLQLITDYTGLQLTPQQIHDLGEKRMAEIDGRLQAIRQQLGFKGSREQFNAALRHNPRFIAKSPQEVEQRYMGYVARMEPHIAELFSRLPKAPYGVARLNPASEKGMTYGYYQQPTPSDPMGRYYYNGSDLDQRSLLGAQHLIYHELIPGHHFHIGLQLENHDAHPVRQFLLYDAFTEGWAEYAASLGEELKLYSDPYDMYGHLTMQAFLTSRLVVDTGMNYLGMSLQQARDYMKEHTLESAVQIDSETLRYSTDIPAQALGYRLGYEKFWELRHRAEQALGDRFDLKKFHAAAIGEGAMPLDVLEQQIDWFIRSPQQ